jgi:hypothetical protein
MCTIQKWKTDRLCGIVRRHRRAQESSSHRVSSATGDGAKSVTLGASNFLPPDGDIGHAGHATTEFFVVHFTVHIFSKTLSFFIPKISLPVNSELNFLALSSCQYTFQKFHKKITCCSQSKFH